jgi:sugar lactone lactonase YvrE
MIRVNPHGDITVPADRHEGKRLNSPNDLVHRSDGTLYLTDARRLAVFSVSTRRAYVALGEHGIA